MSSDLLTQITAFSKLIMMTVVPFVLASQGTMLGGRTGVYIVAQEGIMLVGASIGFVVSYLTSSVIIGVLAALFVGALFGLILAYFTTTLKMNQFVIGLSLYFIGLGLSTLIPKLVIGVTLTPPLIPTLPILRIPLLADIPFFGKVFFEQNLMVYFSILLTIGLWYFMYKTQAGLEFRSVGENPKAADSLGINVVTRRYLGNHHRLCSNGACRRVHPYGIHRYLYRRHGKRTRLAFERPGIFWRLEPPPDFHLFNLLRSHRSARLPLADRKPVGSLPVPAHAPIHCHPAGDGDLLQQITCSGISWEKLRPGKADSIIFVHSYQGKQEGQASIAWPSCLII